MQDDLNWQCHGGFLKITKIKRMKNTYRRYSRKNQYGIGMVELIPVLLSFALILNFTLGFWGVIHAGILNSIAARNYAFETFRWRSQLNRLRDDPSSERNVTYFLKGLRYHAIVAEGSPADQWFVTTRPIKFSNLGLSLESNDSVDDHSRVFQVRDPGSAKDVYDSGEGIGNVWLRTVYGLCLNAQCRQ
jgi:hypothetical protein